MLRRSLAWLSLAAPLMALAVSARPEPVAEGVWGGPHIRLEVTPKKIAIEWDCAHGSIERTLELDQAGHFDVEGRFAPERGGPVRERDEERGSPARYTGKVEGKTMTLEVTLGSGEKIGVYTLTHGKQSRLVKCL